jgi:hypothetical protein
MDNLSLFILIIIILLLFYIISGSSSKKSEKLSSDKKSNTLNKKFNEELEEEIYQDSDYFLNKLIKNNKTNNKTNGLVLPYFVEMQFHNDYKDVITAFDLMIETGRQIFNRSNLPVTVKELNSNDATKMADVFITQLNEVISQKLNDFADVDNGWKNIQENKQIESGWEKQMTQLGLPDNLYDKGAKKALIKLIRIDKFVMSTTDSQTRYDIFMIVQKENSYDQMVIKVSFVTDREDMNNDRNFFKDDMTVDLNVHIEDLFVIGFMTNHSYGSQNVSMRQDFYTFDNVEKDGMMDQDEIIKQLKKKYMQYQIESNGLTIQMDPQSGNNIAIERLQQKMPIGPI